MDFIANNIDQYSSNHTTEESNLLKDIIRDTHLNVLYPRMISGHLQGKWLSMISHMVKPKTILEIGTFTGYSALNLVEGLQSDGILHTIDINEELEDRVRGHFEKSEHFTKINYIIGDAVEKIPVIAGSFDLVFIDADKINYSTYYDLIIHRVVSRGFIIADNVLWSGKVVEHYDDKDTSALREFNEKVHKDSRVDNLLLPFRDGLMILRKR